MTELHEILERCRELHGPWLAERGEDVQISLLTADELCATVHGVGKTQCEAEGQHEGAVEKVRSPGGQAATTVRPPASPQNSTERISMLPPIVNDDPGDDNDHLNSVSWDG